MKQRSGRAKALGLWVLLSAVVLGLGVMSFGCAPDDDDDDKRGGYYSAISVRGGGGDTGPGGMGGVVQITSDFPGAKITLGPAGVMDNRYLTPIIPAQDLGFNPCIINQNTTIDVYLNQADADTNAVDGEYLLLLDADTLYLREGAGDYSEVGGLMVGPGATLTLGLNSNEGGNTGQDTAVAEFISDVVIHGEVRVKALDTGTLGGGIIEDRAGAPATSDDMGSLFMMSFGSVFLYGRVDLSGNDAAAPGQRGGYGGYGIMMGRVWARRPCPESSFRA